MDSNAPARKQIVAIGLAAEGLLLIVFVIWAAFRDVEWQFAPTATEVAYGLAAILPLLGLNSLLFSEKLNKTRFYPTFHHFKQNIVLPLARQLGVVDAIIISIAAGVGEEAFFRGVLQYELGIIIASALFAVLHFGTATRQYLPVVLVYFAFGLYFGALAIYTDGLWAPIIAHAGYDAVALLFLRIKCQSQ